MGLADLAGRLFELAAGADEDYHVTDHHEQLVDRARSDVLTARLLAKPADRTKHPPAAYLDDGEQPHYVFRGSRLLIVDEDESLARNHPTLQLVVLVSDRRILYVLGGRLSDDVFEVSLSDVTTIYVDEDYPQRHVVVEADHEGDEMTFYADLTMEPHDEAIADGVEYVRSRP